MLKTTVTTPSSRSEASSPKPARAGSREYTYMKGRHDKRKTNKQTKAGFGILIRNLQITK